MSKKQYYRCAFVAFTFLYIVTFSNGTPLYSVEVSQDNVSFECYSVEDGLSQSTVLCIAQDDIGYIWFGTIDGLNRFDGYHFTIYRSNPADENSISDDWITSLFVDREGVLWIGTLGGGLNCYNRSGEYFESYMIPEQGGNPEGLQNSHIELPFTYSFLNTSSITSILEDDNGMLWIGTFGCGLFQFDKRSRSFTKNGYDLPVYSGFEKYIMDMCETEHDEEKALWIATFGGGLYRLGGDDDVAHFCSDPGKPESLSHDFLTDICEGSDRCLWIATLGGGLNRMSLIDGTVHTYTGHSNHPNRLHDNRILSLLKDKYSNLWIGTASEGLDYYDRHSNRFIHFKSDLGETESLGSNEVLSLLKDRTGIIWVGTNLGHGVNKMKMGQRKFNHIRHDPANPNSLNDNTVFCFCEDSDHNLWVGTFKGGLNRYDPGNRTFTHFVHNAGMAESISDNHVRAIYEDSRGFLWVGTFHGGLNRYDRRHHRFIHYRHDADDPQSIGADQVRAIHEDPEGFIWLGTYGGGLSRLDPSTGKCINYRHNAMDSTTISDDRIYDIQEDCRGDLWIATFEGGVNRFDPATGIFKRYQHDPYDVNSLSENRVFSIYYDAADSNIIWFCTSGGGLNKYDIENDLFVHYTEAAGLPNNVVYGILSDDKGFYWLSTNKGISKFFPESETFTNYDVMDGLQSNEFNAGAFYRGVDGRMYFGGINGFNSFHPDEVFVNLNVPPIVITSFKIFDEEMIRKFGPMDFAKRVDLNYSDSFISFEFSALDYANLKKNQYAYKLTGFHDDWIRCGTRRFVNFTNLDPGRYQFYVKGSNSDGIWNEQGTYINLFVHPPFWREWWFYLMILALLILSAFSLHRQRIRRIMQLEHVRLEENDRVRKAVAADFHDELGQKLTRISLFSEIMKRKLKSVSLENLEYIKKINSLSKELAASSRDFIWTLDPDQDTLYDVMVYLKDFGDDVFAKTGKVFRVYGIHNDLKEAILPVEWRRHLILIFKEGMNNILKHASCNNVVFDIVFKENQLKVTLSDDGVGCNLDEVTSKGHGLDNMRRRAKTIRGQLDIFQNIGSGMKIQFTGEIPHMGH